MVHQSEAAQQHFLERRRAESPNIIRRDSLEDQSEKPTLKFPFTDENSR